MTPPLTLTLTLRRLRNLLLRTLLSLLQHFSPSLASLLARLQRSPGLPLPHPCPSYWLAPPAPLAQHNAAGARVPAYADVVVLGSGITGTSVARTLLDWDSEPAHHTEGGGPLEVVMLEARDACSGATGRNGGHITPVLYADYASLASLHGPLAAQQILRFRLAHLPALLAVAASTPGLLAASQAREVEAFDVFWGARLFREARAALARYRAEMGGAGEGGRWRVWEGEGELARLQLAGRTVGALSTRAGAVHPYRFVTGVLAGLLEEYSNFQLFTQTPCTHISLAPSSQSSPHTQPLYEVHTPKGTILTPHVVHATNGWAAHLLPGMQGKIVPARGTMSAQAGWAGLGDGTTAANANAASASQPHPAKPHAHEPAAGAGGPDAAWAGTRSFVFFPTDEAHVYDYLTQQPVGGHSGPSHYPAPQGEFMLGGGFARSSAFLSELGNADDRTWDVETGRYLGRALGGYFDTGTSPKGSGEGKAQGQGEDEQGGESGSGDGDGEGRGRVPATWSGILGISVDAKPWVGRVPYAVSGRFPPSAGDASKLDAQGPGMSKRARGLAAPGEWVAAGYTGEGMVHAWMSGRALAYMVLGLDRETAGVVPEEKEAKRNSREDNAKADLGTEVGSENVEGWFPRVYRISEERWRRAEIEDLFAAFLTG